MPLTEQVGGPKMVHACCWAHARRKFIEAVKLHPDDRVAARLVASMDELFSLDAEARSANLDLAARHQLRLERSRPLLEALKLRIEAVQREALPASALGKAARYTLALWSKLLRFLEYPEIEWSNNLAENSMQPVALGRKNWIHLGSQQAGPKVAAILSVVETCRRLQIPIRHYLADVLPGLADRPMRQIKHLTPAAWASQ